PFTPGAENIPGIVGLAEALRLAAEKRATYRLKTRRLQERAINLIESDIPDVVLNGPKPTSFGNLDAIPTQRAVDNINFSFRYVEGESIMLFLDFEDIVVATGSACASSDLKVNYVLSAIGRDHEMAHGSLRITPGWDNDEEQIDRFVDRLKPIVSRLRAQSTLR
ncbi:MAG TPA: aminotransferase class V-fold PLP-dependent enzyme, partial [Thermotogota bacterium]|nr:aminotransferase class V-fold PLP-dependent enzyme [Thermotogota bacterium]